MRNICKEYQEVFDMLNRGKTIFERGYLHTLGQMKREGLVKVDLCNDGTAEVTLVDSFDKSSELKGEKV
jgi:hypothetical protein